MIKLIEAKLQQALRAIRDYETARGEHARLFNLKPSERAENHQELLAAAAKKRDDLELRIRKGKQRQTFKMIDAEVTGSDIPNYKGREVLPGQNAGTEVSKAHALNSDLLQTIHIIAGRRDKKLAGLPKDINMPGKAEEYGIPLFGDVRKNREYIRPVMAGVRAADPIDSARTMDSLKSYVSNVVAGKQPKPIDAMIKDRMTGLQPTLELVQKLDDAHPYLISHYANIIRHINRARDASSAIIYGQKPPPEFSPLPPTNSKLYKNPNKNKYNDYYGEGEGPINPKPT